MLYTDFLKHVSGCPFCGGKERRLAENELAYITYSIAPYHEHHMLVIPRRHIIKLSELTPAERAAIDNLIMKAVSALEKLGQEHISVLVRDGKADKDGNKSVDHLHYHVVPKVRIGSIDAHGAEREVMTEQEITDEAKILSAALK